MPTPTPSPLSSNEPQCVPEQALSIWDTMAEKLRSLLGNETFTRWFSSASALVNEGVCTISLESETHLLWVETNFMTELSTVVSQLSEITAPIHLTTSSQAEENHLHSRKEDPFANQPSPTIKEAEKPVNVDALIRKAGLNPQKNFENFVVGSSNQFAHAACHAIASGRVQGYNPLFIHCPPGLGKSHLVHALGQGIIQKNPKKRVVYLTGEKFTNNYIEAVRKGTTDAFRKRYRKVDMLILDDIQFLVGKGKCQEEFFHTFNTLLESQGQVVLTSDRPANEIKTFDSRLSSRFEAGLTVSLAQPDFETRMAILQSKQIETNMTIPEEALHFIAQKIKSNVRRLEGALTQASTYCSLSADTLTIPTLEQILADIIRQENTQRVTIDKIQKEVAEHFDIRLADMTSRKRPANIARARQIAMFLSREMTSNSLADIGELFGGRDHGTVIHACKKITGDLDADSFIKSEVQFLRTKLMR